MSLGCASTASGAAGACQLTAQTWQQQAAVVTDTHRAIHVLTVAAAGSVELALHTQIIHKLLCQEFAEHCMVL